MRDRQRGMKIRGNAALLTAGIFLVMGMGACSPASAEEGTTEETIAESQVSSGANQETEVEAADCEEEVFPQGDPVVGIVDRYEDPIIVIIDGSDEDLIYYFFTQNAQVVEGDFPIAAGDTVEITYRGAMGYEGHPGEAVKVERLP